MYHFIVRRQVRKIFEGLSRGDWQSALGGMADRFEHVFPGDHALAGTRRHNGSECARYLRAMINRKQKDRSDYIDRYLRARCTAKQSRSDLCGNITSSRPFL